jgi:OmcA/MtrC family decaheme c-type cytochrome
MRRLYSFGALGAALLALAGSALLRSASRPTFSPQQKVFYAEANQVNFIRPGLIVKITGATIASDGTIVTRFKLTDPKGLALDRDGITTPGAISVSFIAAYIPSGQTQYTAYTTRAQKSPITNVTENQASADSGGVFAKVADGEYTYTFATKAPASLDKNATHTIGAYGSRNLTEFDLGTNYDDELYDFLPSGAKVTTVRDVIKTDSCNQCHQDIGFHGGPRKQMGLCILCHQPQSIDPDTGNTLDMAVFIHKIHAGATLPSVIAGGKYQIIGRNQAVSDYSAVVFPAGVRTCDKCHQQSGTMAATQAANLYKPTRAACGSCHDNVVWATGKNHIDLPQVSDNLCAGCHIKQGDYEFDASILGAHTIPRFSKQMPGVNFTILRVDDAAPGKQATVVFQIKDNAGNEIRPSQMSRLTVLLTGPNGDYIWPGQNNAYLSETATSAVGDGNGTWWWTYSKPLPTTATGSWTAGIEGRREFTLNAGTPQEQKAVRNTGQNKQLAFTVDGSKVAARRQIVTTAQCNACHGALAFHGDARNEVTECIICHNPTYTASGGTGKPNQSIDFRTMVHRIHMGTQLTREYTIGSSKFNDVEYPGDVRNCSACHVNNSQQLPAAATASVNDPASFMKTVPPATAACTSCHDTKSATAHAATNIGSLGESCATCHGTSADHSVDKVHAH